MFNLGYQLITVSACAAAPVRVGDTDKPLKNRVTETEGNQLPNKIWANLDLSCAHAYKAASGPSVFERNSSVLPVSHINVS